jgi:proteasome lid subunit RPN8/RPN11
VLLSVRATETILEAACSGYEARGKEERLGLLFGRVRHGVAEVAHAEVYRGGTRTRTSAVVEPAKLRRRANELRSRLRMRFLGIFHSHPEVAGSFSTAPSAEDRQPLFEDPPALVELIVGVWATTNGSRRRPSERYLVGIDEERGYAWRFAAYRRKGRSLTLIGTRSRSALD